MKKVGKDNVSWITKSRFQNGSPVTQAVSRWVLSEEDLLIHVSNKIVQMNDVLEKEKSFLGRLANKFTGGDLNSIVFDGLVIQQLHDVVGIKTPIPIEIQYQYDVDHNELRGLYSRAKKNIEENTPQPKVKETVFPPSVKRRR